MGQEEEGFYPVAGRRIVTLKPETADACHVSGKEGKKGAEKGDRKWRAMVIIRRGEGFFTSVFFTPLVGSQPASP